MNTLNKNVVEEIVPVLCCDSKNVIAVLYTLWGFLIIDF